VAVDGQVLHQVLGGALVELAAAELGVHEGPQADAGEGAGLARRDVPEQVGDDALGQVVGLHLLGEDHGAELGRETPVAADDAPEEARVGEVVQAAVLAVPLPRREQQGEVPRPRGGQEALLEADDEVLGEQGAHEAFRGHGVPVPDAGHGFGGRDDLARSKACGGGERGGGHGFSWGGRGPPVHDGWD